MWLARSSRGGQEWAVWHEWNRRPYAVLPAGAAWDVIAVPRTWAKAAAGHRPGDWTDVPVLDDEGAGHTYVWVPLGTVADWTVAGTVALGRPWWIAVPRPGSEQTSARWWLRPPGACPRLMRPAALREALEATRITGGGRRNPR
ncbi:hypothetical protein ACFFTQ_00285 [Streptomyces roseofulvus]|uniref:hypothetical protein n=1 Tax=Streptomyces roseofulvus TaxID=33902 RepID=UPI0031F9E831